MQENHYQSGDSLNDLERRLTSWQPDNAGLSAEAMLFAAGRASVRRPPAARFPWPAVAAGLALLAAGLGVWVAAERFERLTVLARQEQPSPAGIPPTPPDIAPTEQYPSNYLALNQRVRTQGPDALAALRPPANGSEVSPPPGSAVLRPWGNNLTAEP
jgi:hypothetical protein